MSNLVSTIENYVMRHRRTWLIEAIYFSIWIASFYIIFWLSWRQLAYAQVGVAIGYILVLFLAVKVICGRLTASFREIWYHANRPELVSLLINIILSGAILYVSLLCWPGLGVPPWVAILDGLLTLLAISSLRVLWHIVQDSLRSVPASRSVVFAGRRAFVELELHRMHIRPTGDKVTALLLEDEHTEGALLRRIPVLESKALELLLRKGRATAVILLTPVSAWFRSEVEKICDSTSVPLELITSSHLPTELVESAGAELLGRPLKHIDFHTIKAPISGKRVMVTGGGGSIGSELVRQLARLDLAELVVVDRAENALFNIEQDLATLPHAFPIRAVILDIQDSAAVLRQLKLHQPEIIFHAAAYKHVPMMERHPAEAFINNVVGTRNLVDAAAACGAETFVFISTDKAVHPTNIMGTTKWLCEMYIKSQAGKSRTRFAAVRFGNVLGSSGSVLPTFIEQIRRSRPLTITHPDMTRFFMSIPEACHLVVQAAALATKGEIFVLDMGEPVKVVDLAHRLIKHAGLRPGDDVPIVYTGIRPGEKLSEQLFYADEYANKTAVPGIWVMSSASSPPSRLPLTLERIEQSARAGNGAEVVSLMAEIVRESSRPPSCSGAAEEKPAALSPQAGQPPESQG